MIHMKKLAQQPFVPLLLVGIGLVVIGATTLGLLFTLHDPGEFTPLWTLATNALVIGLGCVMYAGLRAKGRSIEEAYRLGYDVGFENGFRTGAEVTDEE